MKRRIDGRWLLLSAVMTTSCGIFFGDGGRVGKARFEEEGIHCQYVEGPIPKYTLVDSEAECQAYDAGGEPKGSARTIKFNDCEFYAPSPIDGTTTLYEAIRSDRSVHPCQVSFGSTRVEFYRDGDSYRAKRYVDGALQEDVALWCERGTAGGSYDDADCDDFTSSKLIHPVSVRGPRTTCSFFIDDDDYCFEFFGLAPSSDLSYFDECSPIAHVQDAICSYAGYLTRLCELKVDSGKTVIGWDLSRYEAGEEACSRIKSVGEFDKLVAPVPGQTY